MSLKMLGAGKMIFRVSTRSLSTGKRIPEIQKSVFISQSNDIFRNLALEDWLYRNFNFDKHHVLLLWQNDPCVVIGRHQNPWLEADTKVLDKADIQLARRNSGGGTVYHDNGNLNLTFFTPKERYDRRYNLQIISRALYRNWGLETEINKRDDIIVEEEFKISGTAAKLGRPNAYHHCTLLVDVDKSTLSSALLRKEDGIETNATSSTISKVKNLKEINKQMDINRLITAIGWEFLRTDASALEDGGYDLIQKQKGFQLVNPSEDWFPGIEKLDEELRGWEWRYGRTPNFTVTRLVDVTSTSGVHRLTLILEVIKGIVEEVRMSLPASLSPAELDEEVSVVTSLRGTQYRHDVAERIVSAIGGKTVSVDVTRVPGKSNMIATQ